MNRDYHFEKKRIAQDYFTEQYKIKDFKVTLTLNEKTFSEEFEAYDYTNENIEVEGWVIDKWICEKLGMDLTYNEMSELTYLSFTRQQKLRQLFDED